MTSVVRVNGEGPGCRAQFPDGGTDADALAVAAAGDVRPGDVTADVGAIVAVGADVAAVPDVVVEAGVTTGLADRVGLAAETGAGRAFGDSPATALSWPAQGHQDGPDPPRA